MTDGTYHQTDGEGLPPPINSREEALAWAREQVEQTIQYRLDCNTVFPGDRMRTVRHQQRAHDRWLVKLGGALGVLGALLRTGHLDTRAYMELREEAMATLTPVVVGNSS